MAVVGASGGLGTPIARTLAQRGAHLVLAGPHIDRLDALAIPGAVAVHVDLRDTAAGDRVAAIALERHGRLDGVVNAAGVVAFGALADTDDVTIEELFLTNVIGPLWLLRRLVPLLAASQGFVLNISAVVAEQPLANMAVYSATKAALTAADRALARELRRSGIHVCDARPPHTETGLASRPLAGQSPPLRTGLHPDLVAARIVTAIEQGETEVASEQFAASP
ncbi:MAG: SDR family NAD(P)-dependent oxidoreductase [Acidimicrobiales bacterium]|nr:SDR family NAD(P)-dependent oxidoreductase [Acidimicrobiales bacterium]